MNSLWKDLLFLHGHIAQKDLPWRTDTSIRPDERDAVTVAGKPQSIVPMRCALVWPRIVRPR